jgi:hypothetical protein
VAIRVQVEVAKQRVADDCRPGLAAGSSRRSLQRAASGTEEARPGAGGEVVAQRVSGSAAAAEGSNQGQRQAKPAQQEHPEGGRIQGELGRGGPGGENAGSERASLRVQQGAGRRVEQRRETLEAYACESPRCVEDCDKAGGLRSGARQLV